MDAIRPAAIPVSKTGFGTPVLVFHPPTLIAYTIRRAAFLTDSERLALADRLERLPHPDNAAGRFLARRIRQFQT